MTTNQKKNPIKETSNNIEHRLQRYGKKISYIFENKILCCAEDCQRGKWQEDYYKENGKWWEDYKDGVYQERPNFPEGGCYNCGGGGVIAHKSRCPTDCGVEFWRSPWPMTMYDGKEYRAFCGTELVYDSTFGSMCKDCMEAVNGGSGNIPESSGSGTRKEKSR